MPILRLSARNIDGFIVDDDPGRATEVLRSENGLADTIVKMLGRCTLEKMVVGQTEITPPSFPDHIGRHFVQVYPDGETAVYRMIPKNNNVQLVEHVISSGSYIERPLDGILTLEIPSDCDIIPIIGTDDTGLPRLHEVIFHVPQE